MNNKVDDFKELIIHSKENEFIEYKESKTSLPKSFWETYSSFANSGGGYIFLGVKEGKGKNEIVGVDDSAKLKKDLFNLISNKEKVSFCAIEMDGILEIDFEGKTVLSIEIHEAPDNEKPVYLNNNMGRAFYRLGDGDRLMTSDQIRRMMRDAQPDQDSVIAKGIKFSDLDISSLIKFRDVVASRYPKMEFGQMPLEEFLLEIGAADIERGETVYKKGTVLFFGKVNSIKRIYPKYHVDYFNYKGSSRWIDRICDDEPSIFEMNVYNFFNIVSDKFQALHQQSFELDDNLIRKPKDNYLETLRESLVNCLAHADYISGQPSIKVEVYEGWNRFINPGKLLVQPTKFFLGGDSRVRNEVLMKMFRLIGMSERQGFGGKTIYLNSVSDNYRHPEINSTVEYTELKVWNQDIADSYPELQDVEKNVLRYLHRTGVAVSIQDLMKKYNTTDYTARKIISRLIDLDLVTKVGSGPSTRYVAELCREEFIGRLQLAINSLRSDV